jgi:hypothetical protein
MGARRWGKWHLAHGATAAVGLVFALLWLTGWVSGVQGQTTKPTEHQVKAAYLYNFGKFVQWPPRTAAAKNDPFRICVLGQNPFGMMLNGSFRPDHKWAECIRSANPSSARC